MNQRIAARAVIHREDGRVLILREASTNPDGTNVGLWQNVGGRIDPGEPHVDGLLREIREETGLTNIMIEEPLYVGEWFPVIKGEPNHIVAIFFSCAVNDDQEIVLSAEHDKYEWIERSDIKKFKFMAHEDTAIEQYFMRSVD